MRRVAAPLHLSIGGGKSALIGSRPDVGIVVGVRIAERTDGRQQRRAAEGDARTSIKPRAKAAVGKQRKRIGERNGSSSRFSAAIG